MQPIRKINNDEKKILRHLVELSSLELPIEWDENLLIQKMDDGEMGSFLIYESSSDVEVRRKFGKQVSEYTFIDDDGVPVLVSLNLDDQNKLFEVDIWKVDYRPVINLKMPPSV